MKREERIAAKGRVFDAIAALRKIRDDDWACLTPKVFDCFDDIARQASSRASGARFGEVLSKRHRARSTAITF